MIIVGVSKTPDNHILRKIIRPQLTEGFDTHHGHLSSVVYPEPLAVPQICLSLVRLLHYLAHSPLGSVTLLDFRPRQFVLVGGELKVTDLDDASAEEAVCTAAADCAMEFPARNFTLSCHRGRCVGINEKRNLYNAYR